MSKQNVKTQDDTILPLQVHKQTLSLGFKNVSFFRTSGFLISPFVLVFPFSEKHKLEVKVLKILETPTPLLNRPLYLFTSLVSEGSDPI